MIVIPAIDVRAGRCVRLRQGDYQRETVYDADPAAAAMRLTAAGATRLHVVDLDAARGRPEPASSRAVASLLDQTATAGVVVQVGGGIRSPAAAQRCFDSGASFVVLGSLAVRQPELAEQMCARFRRRVLLALDVRQGQAQSQGWHESAGRDHEHLTRWRSWPAAGVIHTDVSRDGTLSGPSLDAVAACVDGYEGPVFASGGIRDADDVTACAQLGACGVIIGRAVHQGSVDLEDLLRRFGDEPVRS